MKLSIIIPVYNVEQFVGKCIESCLEQDIPRTDYEIIVVNDGSPDNSVVIVKYYMQRYPNIRLVNRENGGLSAARNTGLMEAQGQYVWFVDSDDWIEPNVLGTLLDKAFSDNLDVLCFNLQMVFPSGEIKPFNIRHKESGKCYKGIDFLSVVKMPPAACVALYRRDLLENKSLRFYEGILHEDHEFTPRAYCLADRISYIDKVVYNYNQREGSIMRSKKNERKCINMLLVADSLYAFTQCHRDMLNQEAYWTLMNHVSFAVSQSLANYNTDFFKLVEYKQKPYYPLCINPLLGNKEKWKYRLVNFSIVLYLKIRSLKKLV